MFGWGKEESPQAAAGPSQPTAPSPPPPRTFESLVEEELPIQRHSVAMQGGMPSCMTIFDDFVSCYSLGSQFKSIYRHGSTRDCTPKFEDFKFCMSMRKLSDEKREDLWVKRRAEWWARRRLGRSSEDVWDARKNLYTDPLEENRQASQAGPADATA
ncbi:hypothetical protein JCM10296v2_005933 [Rhodotorula toruloides]